MSESIVGLDNQEVKSSEWPMVIGNVFQRFHDHYTKLWEQGKLQPEDEVHFRTAQRRAQLGIVKAFPE